MTTRSRTISYGKCFLCGKPFAKNTISRHLKKCVHEHDSSPDRPVRLFHLSVQGRYAPAYWMHLEIPASTTLAKLDNFLRATWLECCGHLSAFTIDNVSYELDTGMVDAMWKDIFGAARPTASMKTRLDRVLSVGKTFIHEYDFGTTTELQLKVVGERKGSPPQKEVRVLARNYAPVYPCIKCQQPGKWLNVWSGGYETYCDTHAKKHKDWDEAFLPVVNSPRVGECGYIGPRDESLLFEEIAPER